jgi:periplasmic protein TonB
VKAPDTAVRQTAAGRSPVLKEPAPAASSKTAPRPPAGSAATRLAGSPAGTAAVVKKDPPPTGVASPKTAASKTDSGTADRSASDSAASPERRTAHSDEGSRAPSAPPAEKAGVESGGIAPATDTAQVDLLAAASAKPAAAPEMNVDSVDSAPASISRPAPAYPPAARQMKIEGSVLLQVLVTETGEVGEVRVVRASSQVFAQAARDAVKRWRYTPATKDGAVVKTWIVETIDFKVD